MHGRLKVKTTAQQEAERKAEREKKCAAYKAAMNAILDRREAGMKDDVQLKSTAQVLMGNPDITTLWNIRKEILEHKIAEEKNEKKDEQQDEDGAPATKTDLDVVLRSELDLTQHCLMTNPKSYGAWYHRCWCLERMSEPQWDREVRLCNKYLELDERNFHCWDYRRFVITSAGISPAEELAYTMERINANFSNYSSWHYRSKLLPLVYPAEGGIQITEEKTREELDLIQNAAFTDPEDSSAWFYHTWILGGMRDKERRSSESLAVLEQDLQNCRELIELEPDSKWTRLSMVLVMLAIDKAKHHEEILASIHKLKEVDPMRKNYLEDFKKRIVREFEAGSGTST